MPLYEVMKPFPISTTTNTIPIDKADIAEIILNNSVLHKDMDYIILESGMVQFNTVLTEDDNLVVNYTSNLNKQVVGNNSSKSVYQKASQRPTLQNNVHYNFLLSVRKQQFTSDFYSKFSPFYVSNPMQKLKTDIGELFDAFSEKDLAFAIYDAGKEFDDILLLNSYDSTSIDDIGKSIRERWVRYKTGLNLINSVYLSKTQVNGSQRKRAGNIEVQIDHKIPYRSDMVEKVQKEFDSADYDLNNTVLGIKLFNSFVKGGNTTYPLNARTW